MGDVSTGCSMDEAEFYGLVTEAVNEDDKPQIGRDYE